MRERAATREMVGAAMLDVMMPAMSDALIGDELQAALGRQCLVPASQGHADPVQQAPLGNRQRSRRHLIHRRGA